MAKEPKNPLLRGLQSLNNITKSTNMSTYGVSRNIGETLSGDVDNFIDKIMVDSDKDKSLINSHMSRYRLANSYKGTGNLNIYDIQKELMRLFKPSIVIDTWLFEFYFLVILWKVLLS